MAEPGPEDLRRSRRSAAVMVAVGLVALAVGALAPDERFAALGLVLGVPTAAVGLLSLLYGRLAPHVGALWRQRR